MSSADAAIYSGIRGLYTADTGAGGLNNTTSSAYVRSFLRRGDPTRTPTGLTPRIEVEIVSRETSPFGDPGASGAVPAGKRLVDAVVVLHLFTHRDTAFAAQEAVVARMDIVYWRREPATSNNWSFSRLTPLAGQAGPASDTEVHWVSRYRLLGTYTPA